MFWNYSIPIYSYPIAAIVAAVILIPKLSDRVLSSRIFWIIGALLFVSGMLLLPSENHLLGDGLTHIGATDRIFAPTEPLDILLHHLMYRIFGDNLLGYRIISFVAGLFFLYGLYLISRSAVTIIERSIIVLSFLCSATIQFYFGYVESYTMMNLFTLYFFYFSWKEIRMQKESLLPLLFFGLATVSHFSAAALLPAVIYLYRNKLKGYFIIVPILVLIAGFLIAMRVNVAVIFVPLIANNFSTYSLFSQAHLLDLLYLIILISPAFYLAFFGSGKGRIITFTLLALIGTLLFTILVDPKIGAFRDRDLMSIFAMPLAALIALRVPKTRIVLALLAVTFCLRILPWLIFNSQLQTEFVKKAVNADLNYTKYYDGGQRLLSWGYLLNTVGDLEGMDELYQKYFESSPNPGFDSYWKTLLTYANVQYQLGKFKDAFYKYEQLVNQTPADNVRRYHACFVAFRAGLLKEALALMEEGPREFQENPSTRRLYYGIRGALGDHLLVANSLVGSVSIDTDPYLPFMLARSCFLAGKKDLALQLINRSLELDPMNPEYNALRDSIDAR